MCDYGHLQDFPWREWVHQSVAPTCDRQLYLHATGGATLAAQRVTCDCGGNPNLSGITNASTDSTELTSSLAPGERFLCRGITPWHGSDEAVGCPRPLRGSLRSASNVYFPLTRSAIYLPRDTPTVPADLIALLERPPLSTLIEVLAGHLMQ